MYAEVIERDYEHVAYLISQISFMPARDKIKLPFESQTVLIERFVECFYGLALNRDPGLVEGVTDVIHEASRTSLLDLVDVAKLFEGWRPEEKDRIPAALLKELR